MKKIQSKYIPFLAAFLVFFQYSCNKALDLKPINEISDADFWRTADQFKLAANEFYTYEISFAQVLYDNSAHTDLRGDFVASRNAFSNGTNSLSATDNNWNTGYTRL